MSSTSFLAALLGLCFLMVLSSAQNQRTPNRFLAYQPKPTRLPSGCSDAKSTQCLGMLMRLDFKSIIETFKIYELFSFNDISEEHLRRQERVAKSSCSVFNEFNECTGGHFLECFDKDKIVGIIRGFAAMSQKRGGKSTMMDEIFNMISENQVDFAGSALIGACRRIQSGEVKLAELAMCIRKDKELVNQLASFGPLSSSTTPSTTSGGPLSFGRHCKVFRCDVSRVLIHMLVQAAQRCSDEKGSNFIFWFGKTSLKGVRTAAPSDIVVANGPYGSMDNANDQCIIGDDDYNEMKQKSAKTFAEIGITRASQLCAVEVATTTVVFRYNGYPEPAYPRPADKIAFEMPDDLTNDEYWEDGASSLSSSFVLIFISLILMVFYR